MTPAEIERFPKKLENHFSDLEMRIMDDIVRRILINGEITRSADWQINRLKELGESSQNIKKYIGILLANTDIEISKLYMAAAEQDWTRDKDLYAKVNKQYIQVADNEELQQLVKAVSEQTKKEFSNITNSLGFARDTPTGIKSEELSQYYVKTLDNAMLDIASGAFDYNTVLKRTVKEMTKSGLRSIDYESGWSNRVQVACNRAISTGLGQLVGKISEMHMDALDTDYVEVSWHGTARTGVGVGNHQAWQGRVYHWNLHNTKPEPGYKDFIESTGYRVNPLGLHGYNCRHEFYTFIPGISKRIYTDEELQAMNDKENTPKEFRGKNYTSYEATQRMRKLETIMRAQRQEIKLLQDGKAAKDDIIAIQSRYRASMDEYVKFAEKMDLPQQRQRIYGDGLGNVGGRGKLASTVKGDIIKVSRVSLTAEPNSITQKVSAKGGIERNYYDEKGKQYKQISNNNHGNSKKHPYGKNGEHAHDYTYDADGKVKRHTRDLTAQEREENADIL